jgi:hypothetical protein
MMHDRFEAQLRGHLLSTADTRPADGQLSAIVDAVAGTAQRHPITARLLWFPARVGPVPTRLLRYGLVLALLAATVATAVFVAGDLSTRTAVLPTAGPTAVGPVPGCVDYASGGPYGARLGSLFVTMDVPAGAVTPWHGWIDGFHLTGSCQTARPIDIVATVVTTVYADACHPETSGVAVTSPADAVAQLTAQQGHDSEALGKPGLLNGYPVTRFQVSASSACNNYQLWNGASADDVGVAEVDLIDADGVPLGILARYRDKSTDAQRQEAEQMLATLHVTSGLAVGATNPPFVPECIEFDAAGTYAARVGTLPVSLRAPGTTSEPWSGTRDRFYLGNAACADSGTEQIHIIVEAVDQVYGDACHRTARVNVTSAAEAVAAVLNQKGHATVGPVETNLGSYPATRLDIGASTVDLATCDHGEMDLWGGKTLVQGMQVYLLDVDGMVLGVTATYDATKMTSADLDQIAAILATLHVGP